MKSYSLPATDGRHVPGVKYLIGRPLCLIICGIFCAVPVSAEKPVDFAQLALEEESFWNGADLSGGFTADRAHFNNDYDTEWNTWSGWAYSNVNDTETRGHLNQYAAITGESIAANGIYGIANVNDWLPFIPTIELPADTAPHSITVTNTTYSYYAMLEGDDFAKAFNREDEDWFLLTITGKDADGEVTGEIDFHLADFRFEDPEDAYIINEWTVIDLTSLGDGTRSLAFTLSSSDAGIFGMNTPAYFAMGKMTVAPAGVFHDWLAMLPEEQQPPEHQRGHFDEPAGDGLNNLLKYALGLMPLTPSVEESPRISVTQSNEDDSASGEYLAMEFVRSKNAAVEIGLEGSSDLTVWEAVPFTTEVLGESGDDRERVRFRSAVETDAHNVYFLRLNVALSE